jgi:hypothetical protein
VINPAVDRYRFIGKLRLRDSAVRSWPKFMNFGSGLLEGGNTDVLKSRATSEY